MASNLGVECQDFLSGAMLLPMINIPELDCVDLSSLTCQVQLNGDTIVPAEDCLLTCIEESETSCGTVAFINCGLEGTLCSSISSVNVICDGVERENCGALDLNPT